MPACRSLERLSRRKWRPTSSQKRRLRYSRKKSASKEPPPPLAAPKHERLLFGDEKNRGATTANPKRLQERLYCVNVSMPSHALDDDGAIIGAFVSMLAHLAI